MFTMLQYLSRKSSKTQNCKLPRSELKWNTSHSTLIKMFLPYRGGNYKASECIALPHPGIVFKILDAISCILLHEISGNEGVTSHPNHIHPHHPPPPPWICHWDGPAINML